MIIDALALSLGVSVMLAVIVTLVPVVAVDADADVVTELTDAETETMENKITVKIESVKNLLFILSRPENVGYIDLLGICIVRYICICKHWWCKS